MHFPTGSTAHTTAFDGPVVGPLVGTENSPNCKCIHHAGSIRQAGGSKPLQQSALPPKLRCATHTYPDLNLYIVSNLDTLAVIKYLLLYRRMH